MKQIKKLKLITLLLVSALIALMISFSIVKISKERIITKITLDINNKSKYTDYIESTNIRTSFTSAPDFIRILDDKLRNKKELFGLKNQCLNIKKLKGTLPISFSMVDRLIEIEITANSRNDVDRCSNFIIEQIALYNERIRERYRENYIYFKSLNKGNKQRIDQLKKINTDMLKVMDIKINELSKIVNKEIFSKKVKDDSDVDYNLDLMNYYLLLDDSLEDNFHRKMELVVKELELSSRTSEVSKEEFFSVVDKINTIIFNSQFSYVQRAPEFYQIFLATYMIIIFLYVFSRVILGSSSFKKIFSKNSKLI